MQFDMLKSGLVFLRRPCASIRKVSFDQALRPKKSVSWATLIAASMGVTGAVIYMHARDEITYSVHARFDAKNIKQLCDTYMAKPVTGNVPVI